MKLTISTLVLLAIVGTGCKKMLEPEPIRLIPNDQAITSMKDLQAVTYGMYDMLQSGNVHGGNTVAFAELLGDDAGVTEQNLSAFGTLEIYNQSTSIQLGPLRDMWRDSYKAILTANYIINAVEDGKLSDSADYNPAWAAYNRAEALVARGYTHFELCRLWGEAYDVEMQGSNTQPGVPYRTEALDNPNELDMARHTVEEVYAMAAADLEQAATLFADAPNMEGWADFQTEFNTQIEFGRFDEMAARALLSRVYFYKGDYVNSANQADMVIASSGYSMATDNNEPHTQVGDVSNPECICQLVSTNQDKMESLRGWYSRMSGSPTFKLDTALYNLHEDVDTRRTDNFFLIGQNVAKYDLANNNNGLNRCLVRLGEMYLNRAESNLSPGGNGNDATALADLNVLLDLRLDTSEASTVGLLEKVQLQRRLELAFEGDRYHNLRRMKQSVRFGSAWNAPELLFKIPQEEIAGNSLIEQNP